MAGFEWDPEKNAQLQRTRHISFERIAELITEGQYLGILEHPVRKNQ